MVKLIHILFNYRLALLLQAVIALSFLFLLIKINVTIKSSQAKLQHEIERSGQLQNILDALATEFPVVSKNVLVSSLTSVETPVKIKRETPVVSKSKTSDKIQVNSVNTKDTNLSKFIVAPPAPEAITINHYRFEDRIRLGKGVDIYSVEAMVYLLSRSEVGENKIKAELSMIKSSDIDGMAVEQVRFTCVKAVLDKNNILTCLFRQTPADMTNKNELDPANHHFNIGLSLSGSVSEKTINCLMVWDDITGRPLNARFKMPLIIK